MTLHEAIALALLGAPRRRFLGAFIRTWLGRPLAEIDDLPVRRGDEPLVVWACRAAAAETDDDAGPLLDRADRVLREATRLGQRGLSVADPAYPDALRQVPDPPPVVWVRGDAEALVWPRLVAVIGARAATPAGLVTARAIGAGLARAGVVVVSGLARGIDSAAHQAALDAGGASIAVLGSSLERIYPPEHHQLAEVLAAQGALVSEHVPGTPPLAFHFPLRNRIISGLSAAVVVVEASEKSGSLITATAAAEQGREVMAVPGPVGTGRHRGGHALLRDGATLVEGPDDVLAALGWGRPTPSTDGGGPGLDPAVARELGVDPAADDFSADEVAMATGWPISRVNARIAALELAGTIQRLGGGRFVGVKTRVLR